MKELKYSLMICLTCLSMSCAVSGCSSQTGSRLSDLSENFLSSSKLSSKEDLDLESHGGGDYTFQYADEEYEAEFDTDTWTIRNSYRIKNSGDILLICEALSEEHPVPGRDRESYRTPKDMAFEWEQHNLAYDQLPKGNYWSESAKNVDLDPDDQGKTFKEIYEDRTGKKLDFDTVIEHSDKIEEKAREKLGEEGIDLDDLDIEKIKKKLDVEKIKKKLDTEEIKKKLDTEEIKKKVDSVDFQEKLNKIKEKIKELLNGQDED